MSGAGRPPLPLTPEERLIFALDVPDRAQALEWVERLGDGVKLRVVLAAQVMKGEIARLQGCAQIGLPGKGGCLQHRRQRRAVVPAA